MKEIKAKVLVDSLWTNHRLTTMELQMPKFILAEFNTHRVFSRNSASSRAIPVEKMISQLEQSHFIPEYIGKNKKGMNANEEIEPQLKEKAIELWEETFNLTLNQVKKLKELGIHKQTINRLLEPFMFVKTLCTSTEWNNFFNLRCSKLAQPEMEELANKMKEAYEKSQPRKKHYHLPFVEDDLRLGSNIEEIFKNYSMDNLFKLSSARCARISYENHNGDYSITSDYELANHLRNNGHLSPMEHSGLASMDKIYWKNLKGWKSYRQMIEEIK